MELWVFHVPRWFPLSHRAGGAGGAAVPGSSSPRLSPGGPGWPALELLPAAPSPLPDQHVLRAACPRGAASFSTNLCCWGGPTKGQGWQLGQGLLKGQDRRQPPPPKSCGETQGGEETATGTAWSRGSREEVAMPAMTRPQPLCPCGRTGPLPLWVHWASAPGPEHGSQSSPPSAPPRSGGKAPQQPRSWGRGLHPKGRAPGPTVTHLCSRSSPW